MLAPLAIRDTTYWVGTAGNPAPRYITFDAASSGYSQPVTNVPAFVSGWYPDVTYQTIFKSHDVYVFERTHPRGSTLDTGG
jgi:hypothetical protein